MEMIECSFCGFTIPKMRELLHSWDKVDGKARCFACKELGGKREMHLKMGKARRVIAMRIRAKKVNTITAPSDHQTPFNELFKPQGHGYSFEVKGK